MLSFKCHCPATAQAQNFRQRLYTDHGHYTPLEIKCSSTCQLELLWLLQVCWRTEERPWSLIPRAFAASVFGSALLVPGLLGPGSFHGKRCRWGRGSKAAGSCWAPPLQGLLPQVCHKRHKALPHSEWLPAARALLHPSCRTLCTLTTSRDDDPPLKWQIAYARKWSELAKGFEVWAVHSAST